MLLPFATLFYTLALAFVSLLPAGPQAPGGWDTHLSADLHNFLHLPAYAGLTLLVLAAADGRLRTAAGTAALVSACILVGVALEGLQAYIPGRYCSLGDIATNAAGAVLGLAAWRAVPTKFAFPSGQRSDDRALPKHATTMP